MPISFEKMAPVGKVDFFFLIQYGLFCQSVNMKHAVFGNMPNSCIYIKAIGEKAAG